MPVSKEFQEAMMAKLGAARSVRGKRMFGGVGVYSDDIFFAVLDDDRVFFKTDDGNRAEYEAAGMGPWAIESPTGGTMPYHEVPSAVIDDPETLGQWIDAAVEVAKRKKRR